MDKLIFTSEPEKELRALLEEMRARQVFYILPASSASLILRQLPGITVSLKIDDSEAAKTLSGVEKIWNGMLAQSLSRDALVVNIGGGVTTDMGGFAAACYMRGVRYINVPTTLLAMVDASAGGKTGVDFEGVKNIIGAFRSPEATIISPAFLATLPEEQLLSGYGEMLKHGLLQGEPQLSRMLSSLPSPENANEWMELIRESVLFKESVVNIDPLEHGPRRALNLGHTAGHPFEALALQRGTSVTHGCAVAQGLVTALVLSVMKAGFPSPAMQRIAAHIKGCFPPVFYSCRDYDALLAFMRHDKKNRAGGDFAFTLLEAPGRPVCGIGTTEDEVKTALDITCDLLGI